MKQSKIWIAALMCAGWLAATTAPARANDAIAQVKGIRGEMIASLDEAGQKLIELAQATPESLYSWRPGKGVRSTGEVLAHVIGGDYLLSSLFGVKPPADLDLPGLEKSPPGKPRTIELLKASLAWAEQAIAATPDDSLAARAKRPDGRDATKATVCMIIVTHSHEHLGQMIAYARMNGIVPPWTARQQAAADAKAAEKTKKP